MSLSLPLSPLPSARVRHHEDLNSDGRLWDICRTDDTDPQMVSPMDMGFSLSAGMLNPVTSAAVWSKWYGSLRLARDAGKKAGRKLSAKEVQRSGHLDLMEPIERLTQRLNLDLKAMAYVASGNVIHHAQDEMPMTKINAVMSAVLGEEICNQIYIAVTYNHRSELAETVEHYFPAMRALHQEGLMLRSASQSLIAIGLLTRRLDKELLMPADVELIKLLISCLMFSLPYRLSMVVAVSTPTISDIFVQPCMFYGITASDLTSPEEIWAKVPEDAARSTALCLSDYTLPLHYNAEEDDQGDFEQLIRRIDTASLSAQKGLDVGGELNSIYQDFLGEFALAETSQMEQLLREGSMFFEVPTPVVPSDLVLPGLNMDIASKHPQVCDALYDLVIANLSQNCSMDMEVLREFQAMIEFTGERVRKLSLNATAKDVDKIQRAGKAAMKDLERGKSWFSNAAESYTTLISCWESFNSSIRKLRG